MRGASLVAAAALVGACATSSPRMRLVTSEPIGAAWSFVVEDHGRAAQLLVDGRPREGCSRAGVTLRCELRGLFPGGHTLELRLAGGVLRRTAVLGVALGARPVLVRARDLGTVAAAAHAGADGVLVPAGLEPGALEELVEAGHKAGTRVLVEVGAPGDVERLIERYAFDGVVGAPLPPSAARRFPAARALAIDAGASRALADHLAGAPLELARLADGAALVETHGALGLGLALATGRGAIADGPAFALLGVRRRHKALREGGRTVLADDGRRRAVRVQAGGDALTLVANAGDAPYAPAIELPPMPIDLLGGPMRATGPTVPPGELAAILASPDPDRTKY